MSLLPLTAKVLFKDTSGPLNKPTANQGGINGKPAIDETELAIKNTLLLMKNRKIKPEAKKKEEKEEKKSETGTFG